MLVLSPSFLLPSWILSPRFSLPSWIFSPRFPVPCPLSPTRNSAKNKAWTRFSLGSYAVSHNTAISLLLLFIISAPESIKKLGKLLPMAFTPTPPRKYDVFLISRRADTRMSFTGHLYHKLRMHNFDVFIDDAETERGITINEKLLRAIEESKTAIIVISPNFASSSWCLDVLVKVLECMEGTDTILPVFYNVDPSHVRDQLGSFAKAFEKHEERFKEDLLKVQLWRDALTKLANFVGWVSWDYMSEVELLDQIVQQVKDKVGPAFINPEDREGTPDATSSAEWNFLLTALVLEIFSAAFDQASSPSKPHYALIGMLLAIAAVIACTWELIHKKSLVWQTVLGCFYYLHPSNTLFGSLPDIFGLVSSIYQCVFSTVQYIYFSHHVDSPIKLSLLPALFLICMAGSTLYRNQRHNSLTNNWV